MTIKQFEVTGLAQYSYVVSDGGEAVVIDPIRDVERYVEYAAAEGLRITQIVETHIHADFAAGSMALQKATGAELAFSAYDAGELYEYAMPHRALRDGDAVQVGGMRLVALHTPGHTPEHVSFLLYEEGATEPVAMFSGDFLFVGSLGRPDLLGEAAKVGLAHELYHSVAERLVGLPDGLVVYPGHGAGSLCGAGMGSSTETTLGHERAFNPFFKLQEEDFVRQILGSVPPMPKYYPRMKVLNAKGSPVLETVPGGAALSVAEVAALMAEPDVTLVDVRSVAAFGAGHVAGSVSLGTEGSQSLWAGWVLDAEDKLVLVGEGGDEVASRLALVRVGLDGAVGYLAGGVTAWVAAGRDLVRAPLVTAAELAAELAGELGTVTVLDVRDASEVVTRRIAGSQHVALGDLVGRVSEVGRDKPVVTVCEGGYRASLAASLLQRAGFVGVRSLAGGMGAWDSRETQV